MIDRGMRRDLGIEPRNFLLYTQDRPSRRFHRRTSRLCEASMARVHLAAHGLDQEAVKLWRIVLEPGPHCLGVGLRHQVELLPVQHFGMCFKELALVVGQAREAIDVALNSHWLLGLSAL